MKLNKVNKNGSLSIILPKTIINELNLEEGQEVTIKCNSKNSIVFSVKDKEQESIKHILKEIANTKQTFDEFLATLPDSLLMQENIVRELIRQRLLAILEVL